MPPALLFLFLFLLGIAAGSFLNVCILRYNPDERIFLWKKLKGRSRCMHCRKTLSWMELIPLLSFAVQRGKCKTCKKRLTVQYPLVELAGGAVFVGVPFFLNSFFSMHTAAFAAFAVPLWYYALVGLWILAFLLLIAATVIDIRHLVIPDALNIGLAIIGIGITAVVATHPDAISVFRFSFLRHLSLLFSPWENPIVLHAVGAVAGSAVFFLLSALSRGRAMGFGDVKLAFGAGLILGWPDIAFAVFLSFILGGLWGLGLIVMGRKTMRDKVPFAPFFVLAFAATVFFGFDMLSGYFRLFNIW